VKRLIITGVIALLACSLALAAGQPAAKATAKVSKINVLEATEQADWTQVFYQQIKAPGSKDLFIDVSFECGLITDTTVQSAKGKKTTATANSEVLVKVLVDGEMADPGVVYYCQRKQELTATFDGLLTQCLIPDAGCALACELSCTTDGVVDQACVDDCTTGCGLVVDPVCLETLEPEEVGLLLETMSANSFNFVHQGLDFSGVHEIEVYATIATSTSVEGEAVYGSAAEAKAMIGKGTVTVETVRMINGEDVVEIE
jgi:hypothetical protein